ncbi:MAG: hypothetical protein QOG56_1008 [Solirubrobacteraceae bacterium]|nr:hypothetical protein [Solirubrobacteraceae bacterium]
MLARLLTIGAVCVAVLPGCGGASDGGDRARAATAAPPAAPPAAPAAPPAAHPPAAPAAPPAAHPPAAPAAPADPRDPRELPAGVPVRASRAVDPRGMSVIRAWTDALRAGDVEAANALWAAPAKVQNGTPVLTLASPAAIALFNGSLPCGSVVTSAGGAPAGFTIATVRLTRRRGARCDAVGASARVAIRVRDGRIAEWYRLPDDPAAPGLRPPPDDPEATTV